MTSIILSGHSRSPLWYNFEVMVLMYFHFVIRFDPWFIFYNSTQAATTLPQTQRPLLHSTTVALLIVGALMILRACNLCRTRFLQTLPFVVLISLLSHHLRDGSRRGLWLWPIDATIPVPYSAYIASCAVLPWVVAQLRSCFPASRAPRVVSLRVP